MTITTESENGRNNLLDTISRGTNLCYFYKDDQDLLDLMYSYFNRGLDLNEQCVLINSQPELEGHLKDISPNAKNLLRKGQLKHLSYKDCFFKKNGCFKPDNLPYSEKLKQALKKGYDGLRIIINMKWLKRKDMDEFIEYMTSFNSLIDSLKIITLSLFPLTKFRKTEILSISNAYQKIIIKNNNVFEIIENIEDKRVEKQLKEASVVSNGVAHDFNNLLTIIKGNAEMALMDLKNKNSKLSEHLFEIIESTNSARRLVQQLYSIYRDSCHLCEEIQEINLNKLIIKSIELVNLFFKQNKTSEIEIELDLDPEIQSVLVDPGKMEQILLNLIINAKDAMPQGGKIVISTSTIEKTRSSLKSNKNNYVCLSIKDTGIGIPKELIDKIFEPFFTTKGSKGTGFGLFLVKKIIKKYEGWIEVESKPDIGTLFKIYIPVK